MKAIITIAEKSIYHQTLVVETDDMNRLKKILEEEVDGNASDLYGVVDILRNHGIKIIEKDENDSYPWLEVAEIYDVSEIENE